MGNTDTQPKNQNKKTILISNPVFENAKIIKNSQGNQLVQIGISMKSEEDCLNWEKNSKRIPKVAAVLYPQSVHFQNKGCCGSSGIVNIQYQRFPYVLSEEISLRRNNNQGHFHQDELWLLLYTLVSSAQMYHLRKLKVGDIRPQNVFLNSNGQIKVLSQYSYPYGATNYEKTLMNREIITYLAPEEIKDIQFGKMKDQNNPAITQTFSMGLTVLDAALLSTSEIFYGDNVVFNYDKLNESLKLLYHIKYSPQLTYLITKMLEPSPGNRLKAADIQKLLKPYQKSILSKKTFDLKQLPSPSQNPETNFNDISSIQGKKKQNSEKKGDFKFIQGVVFDSKDDSLMISSLNQSKQVIYRNSKPSTYQISKSSTINTYDVPVRTTIHYPPITINLPQPNQQVAPQNHNAI